MAKTVFFHVGIPKTGTTFLQTVMWRNRDVLRSQGVLYPGRHRMDHYYASEVIRGITNTRNPNAASAWDRILRSVDSWPDTAVISHEFFGLATAEQARQALDRLASTDVHVVVTARDYVRQFPAVWQEALKMRCDLPLGQFIEQALQDRLTGPWSWQSQDIVAILRRWGASLPSSNVHIVTVPRPGAPRDTLWRRYASLIGIAPECCRTDLALANESLGVRESALLHRIKPRLMPPLTDLDERYRWVRGFLAQEVLAAQDGPRLALRPEEAAAFRARARADVAALRAAAYDVVGDLEDLLPEVPAIPSPHPDETTEGEMLDAAVDAIVDLVARHRQLAKEVDRLRAEQRRPARQQARSGGTSRPLPQTVRDLLGRRRKPRG